jgi:hypothetical protein
MRQVSSRNIQSSWNSARGDEKLFIGSLLPVRQTEAFVSEADLSDTLITLEVHAKVDQGMPGDWQSVDRLLFRFPNFGREHLTLALAAGRNKNAAGKVKS